MDSLKQRDFYIARIDSRISLLQKAIEGNNIHFDIESFKAENKRDLQVVAGITDELIEKLSKEAHDVRKNFRDLQKDLDLNTDAFNKLVLTASSEPG